MDFTLPDENAQTVSSEWFDSYLTHSRANEEEVTALRDYHDHHTTVNEAAFAITRPCTTQPIPQPDQSAAAWRLWSLFNAALWFWPLCCTADLIALLQAVSEISGPLHNGDILETEDRAMVWADLPFFRTIWLEESWETPNDIKQKIGKDRERRSYDRRLYVKRQDVEAQLTAAGIFDIQRAYSFLIWSLERKPESDDSRSPDLRVIHEFHIPAAARWMKANGNRLYKGAVEEEMQKGWHSIDNPAMMLNFDHMCMERWAFWEKRFTEFANGAGGDDELIKSEAESAVQHMKSVAEAWKVKEGQ